MDAGVFSAFAFRPVKLQENFPFTSVGLALGDGPSGLEVLVAHSANEPRLPTVRSAWKARHGGRAAPLMLVVLQGDKATVCGPAGDDPPAYPGIDIGQAGAKANVRTGNGDRRGKEKHEENEDV